MKFRQDPPRYLSSSPPSLAWQVLELLLVECSRHAYTRSQPSPGEENNDENLGGYTFAGCFLVEVLVGVLGKMRARKPTRCPSLMPSGGVFFD